MGPKWELTPNPLVPVGDSVQVQTAIERPCLPFSEAQPLPGLATLLHGLLGVVVHQPGLHALQLYGNESPLCPDSDNQNARHRLAPGF
jgi:hypothetical protein